MPDFLATSAARNIFDGTEPAPRFGNKAAPTLGLAARASASLDGVDAPRAPGRERASTLTGSSAPGYGGLSWFNRIHFSVSTLNLGNVASAQVRTFRVFNSWLTESRALNAVTPANDGGLALAQPFAPPGSFAPLQELTYQLTIDDDGPPTVDATYTFTFDTGPFVLRVVGTRVIAWRWEPDWASPVLERLDWLTDVQVAQDSTEQRVGLVQGARWSYSFQALEQGRSARILENALYAWGGRTWALPVWPDGVALTADATPGASVLAIASTTGRDFGVGRLVVLIGEGGAFEASTATAVGPTSVTVDPPLVQGFAAGTRCYPARTARLRNAETVARLTPDTVSAAVVMQTVERCERPAAVETLYRGLPVLEERPNWTEAPPIEFARKLATLDTGIGRPFVVDESDLPSMVHRYRWTALNRTEANALRAWLYARAGRLRSIWVPTWTPDLELVGTVAPSGTALDVRNAGLAQFVRAGVNRRDLRIELRSGAVFYRRASGFVEIDASTERITIDSALGITINPADVLVISFMSLCRLDADGVELAWYGAEVVESQIALRSFRRAV